jgi:hypothetical protein
VSGSGKKLATFGGSVTSFHSQAHGEKQFPQTDSPNSSSGRILANLLRTLHKDPAPACTFSSSPQTQFSQLSPKNDVKDALSPETTVGASFKVDNSIFKVRSSGSDSSHNKASPVRRFAAPVRKISDYLSSKRVASRTNSLASSSAGNDARQSVHSAEVSADFDAALDLKGMALETVIEDTSDFEPTVAEDEDLGLLTRGSSRHDEPSPSSLGNHHRLFKFKHMPQSQSGPKSFGRANKAPASPSLLARLPAVVSKQNPVRRQAQEDC